MKGKKMIRYACLFTLIGMLSIVPLCSAETSPDQTDKTSIEDVQQKTDELLHTLTSYTADQRDEAMQKTKAALDSMDKRIDAMEAQMYNNWDKMDKAAREKSQASLKALRQQRTKVAEWYGGNGPGSFIGMRIAASVAQGLAWGSGIGIVPVSSLAAVAAAAGSPGDAVAVAQDAHVKEVYLGLYRIDEDGAPVELAPERLQPQAAIAELADLAAAIPAGAGWERYPDLFDANRGYFAAAPIALYPHAGELLTLGARALAAGAAINPAELEPAYLRAKVAATP